MRNLTLILGFYFLCTNYLSAQQIDLNLLSANAGYNESNAISLSWSVGEISTETFSSENLILTQGFQQSDINQNTISTIETAISEILVYPNPATNQFIIELPKNAENNSLHQFEMRIYNINSQLIQTGLLLPGRNNIIIGDYRSGPYLIKITNLAQKVNHSFILQVINN